MTRASARRISKPIRNVKRLGTKEKPPGGDKGYHQMILCLWIGDADVVAKVLEV